MGAPTVLDDSSSGEEDGDAEWRAAIHSIATTSAFAITSSVSNGGDSKTNHSIPSAVNEDQKTKAKPPTFKHYQIKAQKLLDDIVEKNLEIVSDPIPLVDNGPKTDEGGIRLFRNAPVGVVFDHIDELQGPKKRPKLLPGEEINEKSKKFKRQLKSVAVDGRDILAAAKDACQKSLAKLEAKDAKAKAAAKKEEERVAELKKIRGERWLPSMAREMQSKSSMAREMLSKSS